MTMVTMVLMLKMMVLIVKLMGIQMALRVKGRRKKFSSTLGML